MKGLYTNYAGSDILKDCACELAKFCDFDMAKLRAVTILLPTRRAIRTFEELLLDQFDMDTIFLPNLMAVGDIEMARDDEDDIIPPLKPIAGIERILSIMPFIKKHDDSEKSYDARWRQAREMLKLIDLLQTEGLTPYALKELDIKTDMAAHWQKSGGLFVTITNDWLASLESTNRINKAAARIMHIERLTQHYRDNTPQNPIWFIGSTGSIMAVRDLMRAILALPQGIVFLPGLDKEMPEEAWQDIPPSHPQAILKNTSAFLGYEDRRHIQYWPSLDKDKMIHRAQFLSSALSPHPKMMDKGFDNISLVMAANRQEELNSIAQICLEHKQINPSKKIVIVSNDARLPVKLKSILNSYGYNVDASMGEKPSDTDIGVMINHIIALFNSRDDDPILSLWTLLKNPLFMSDWYKGRGATLQKIENDYLCDPLITPSSLEETISLFPKTIADIFNEYNIKYNNSYKIGEWAEIVMQTLPHFINVKTGQSRQIMIQVKDALEPISLLKSDTLKLPFHDVAPIITDHLNNIAIRQKFSADNQKTIYMLGTLEARLIQSDLTIMANLNENIWPDTPAPNPYLSRGMRHAIGLPDSERHAALSGHDFWQAFLSGDIIMTSSKRDGDTPALPSRWLLRLQSVTSDKTWEAITERGNRFIENYNARHEATTITPALPPAPIAYISQSPKSFYVTHVELWRHDPYSFWAKHIARLRKPYEFLGGINAATRGSVWHDILEQFVKSFDPDSTPETQQKCFDEAVSNTLKSNNVPDHMIRLWQSRLAGQRTHILNLERARRIDTKPWKLEERFEGTIEGLTVKAKADRVDITKGRDNLIVSDYKTGAMPSKTNIKAGYACQLSLLALILPKNVLRLDYIDIKGGANTPKPVTMEWDEVFALETSGGFSNWHKIFFADKTPFSSYADFGKMHQAKATDYLQLARFDEWGAGADNDSEVA